MGRPNVSISWVILRQKSHRPAWSFDVYQRLAGHIAAFNPSSRRQGSGQHHVWIDDPKELIRPLDKIGPGGGQVTRISSNQEIAD